MGVLTKTKGLSEGHETCGETHTTGPKKKSYPRGRTLRGGDTQRKNCAQRPAGTKGRWGERGSACQFLLTDVVHMEKNNVGVEMGEGLKKMVKQNFFRKKHPDGERVTGKGSSTRGQVCSCYLQQRESFCSQGGHIFGGGLGGKKLPLFTGNGEKRIGWGKRKGAHTGGINLSRRGNKLGFVNDRSRAPQTAARRGGTDDGSARSGVSKDPGGAPSGQKNRRRQANKEWIIESHKREVEATRKDRLSAKGEEPNGGVKSTRGEKKKAR